MPRYDLGSGKNLSAAVHASRSEPCPFCDARPRGNGGIVAHARGHVRRGEAVEMVKDFGVYPPIINRVFLAATDAQQVAEWEERGYWPNVLS